MAILQQAGLTLRDYGVRCAHLLMRHLMSHQVSAIHPGMSFGQAPLHVWQPEVLPNAESIELE